MKAVMRIRLAAKLATGLTAAASILAPSASAQPPLNSPSRNRPTESSRRREEAESLAKPVGPSASSRRRLLVQRAVNQPARAFGPELQELALPGLPLPEPPKVLTVPWAGPMLQVDQSFGRQPLAFERNDGQVNRQVRFLSRGRGYTLFLTPTEAVMVFRSDRGLVSSRSAFAGRACCGLRTTRGPDARSSQAVLSVDTGIRTGERDGFGVPRLRGRSPEWCESGDRLTARQKIGRQNVAADVRRRIRLQNRLGRPPPHVGGYVLNGLLKAELQTPKPSVLRMRLVGANPAVAVRGEARLRGQINYFIGNDPAGWRTHIPTFARVRLQEVYPGIDLVYYGNEGRLEYDFVVAPGADPRTIAVEFEGADGLQLGPEGDLRVRVGNREVRWRRPQVYQEQGGARREIPGTYRLVAGRGGGGHGKVEVVSFAVAGHDPAQPLVIDPALVYSTYLGGFDSPRSIAGSKGNAYVAGSTSSADFPTTTNAFQATIHPVINSYTGSIYGRYSFVTKFSPTGALIYSTYLGGTDSDYIGADYGTAINDAGGIAVDASGSAYVTGRTDSYDFPVVNAFQPVYTSRLSTVYVTKLSPDGASLVYSTYLGGSELELGGPIAVDAAGDAYVSGETFSQDFPTTTNALYPNPFGQDQGFVAKLTPSGDGMIYSTFFPVSVSAWGIAADAAGNAYISGSVGSDATNSFPIKTVLQPAFGGGPSDGFVAKLKADGTELLFSTYLGGSGGDIAASLALGPDGDIYIGGYTASTNYPLVQPLQSTLRGGSDLTIVRMKGDGSSIVFSTYLGGQGNDRAAALAVDRSGNVYVAGQTFSPDFPLLAAFQTNFPTVSYPSGIGRVTGFISELKSDGTQLLFSSYYGSPTKGSWSGSVCGVDSAGNIYLAGQVDASDLPVLNAFQPAYAGQGDIYVTKLTPLNTGPPLKLTRAGNTLVLTWPASATGFTVEMTDQLGPAATWASAPDQGVVVGDQNVATLDATNAARFYRLSHP